MSDVTEPKVENLEISEKPETVLSDAEFNTIHPLSHEFTLWYLEPQGDNSTHWSELIHELVTVDSVETFWGAFNAVPQIMQLPMKGQLGVFRKGVRPEWEDAAFSKGGSWTSHMRVQDEKNIDLKWQNVVLNLIGGLLEEENGDDIPLGVLASVRRMGVKIQLWVPGDAQASLNAAKKFKTALKLHEGSRIEYKSFDNEKASDGLTVTVKL